MGGCDKLLAQARANARGLSLEQALELARCHGWELVRVRGSHHLLKRPGQMRLLNFQSRGGQVPAYQVRQLLQAIEEGEE